MTISSSFHVGAMQTRSATSFALLVYSCCAGVSGVIGGEAACV